MNVVATKTKQEFRDLTETKMRQEMKTEYLEGEISEGRIVYVVKVERTEPVFKEFNGTRTVDFVTITRSERPNIPLDVFDTCVEQRGETYCKDKLVYGTTSYDAGELYPETTTVYNNETNTTSNITTYPSKQVTPVKLQIQQLEDQNVAYMKRMQNEIDTYLGQHQRQAIANTNPLK